MDWILQGHPQSMWQGTPFPHSTVRLIVHLIRRPPRLLLVDNLDQNQPVVPPPHLLRFQVLQKGDRRDMKTDRISNICSRSFLPIDGCFSHPSSETEHTARVDVAA